MFQYSFSSNKQKSLDIIIYQDFICFIYNNINIIDVATMLQPLQNKKGARLF